jgi:hypothetical protein
MISDKEINALVFSKFLLIKFFFLQNLNNILKEVSAVKVIRNVCPSSAFLSAVKETYTLFYM